MDYDEIKLRASKALGALEMLDRDVAKWGTELKISKNVNSLAPHVQTIINAVQDRIHRQQLGYFEDILTSFAYSVLDDRSRTVKFNLEIKNSQPDLSISLINKKGHSEDVWRGNGGAMTCVLSTGLRFVSLFKLLAQGHDICPILFLDEADQWVSKDNIKAFYETVVELASQLSIQTVIVTHKPLGFLKDREDVQVASLSGHPENDDGVLISNKKEFAYPDDFKGLKSIRLSNFRGYVDQTLSLSPLCTVLEGPNNIGKSALIEAVRCASGIDQSIHDVVRHDMQSASVEIQRSSGKLTWTRNNDKAPATVYRWDGEDATSKETPAGKGSAPDWVAGVLGIHEIDSFDVQVMFQKDGIFVLNQSGARKAAALTIGTESKWLAALADEWKKELQFHRRRIKDCELGLGRAQIINNNLPKSMPCWKDNFNTIEGVEKDSIRMESMVDKVGSDILSLKKVDEATRTSVPAELTVGEVGLTVPFRDVSRYQDIAHIEFAALVPFDPTIPDEMLKLKEPLTAIKALLTLCIPANIPAPIRADHTPVSINWEALTSYTKLATSVTVPSALVEDMQVEELAIKPILGHVAVDKELTEISQEEIALDKSKAELSAELAVMSGEWEECPVCGTTMDSKHEHLL
jgi:hypothetical protein